MSDAHRRAAMQPRAKARTSKRLGPRLRGERVAANVTQADMAARLQITRTALSVIENGDVPLWSGFPRRYRSALKSAAGVADPYP